MRLNLLLSNPGDIRSGYTNVDPFADGIDERVQSSLGNLDALVDNGEAEEIVAHDVFDYMPAAEGDKTMNHWLSKIAHGGTITISVVDLPEVAKALSQRVIDMKTASQLIHGQQGAAWQYRKASYGLHYLADALSARGFKIIKRRLIDFRAIITAERP